MHLTELQQDIIQELVNIGCGKAAGALSRMTDSSVDLSAPVIVALNECELAEYAETFSSRSHDVVSMEFHGSLSGKTMLLLLEESADNLATLLTMGMNMPALDPDMRADVLRETGNVVLISIIGSLSNALELRLNYEFLKYGRSLGSTLPPACEPTASALLIKAGLSLRGRLIHADVLILFTGQSFARLTTAVDRLAKGAREQTR